MATEYTLRRADGSPLGTFEEVQAEIAHLFPTVEFSWTRSGPESLALARERGIHMPPALLEVLPTLPSLLEGVAEGVGYHVTFGLGHEEPVQALYITPRGSAHEMMAGLTALEGWAGQELRVSGE